MGNRLQQEIRQTRPFSSLEVETLLNLQRTADQVQRTMHQVLKPYGLTPTQYNMLRILRGAGVSGLRCSELAERQVSRDPDMTRLLDRLERQKLVRRRRDGSDRRVVYTAITQPGLMRLEQLDPLMEAMPRRLLRHMNRGQMERLIELLELVRDPPEVSCAAAG